MKGKEGKRRAVRGRETRKSKEEGSKDSLSVSGSVLTY